MRLVNTVVVVMRILILRTIENIWLHLDVSNKRKVGNDEKRKMEIPFSFLRYVFNTAFI